MWISRDQVDDLVAQHGTPLFVYSREQLQQRADELLALTLPFGHIVRYAVKANPNPEIVKLFDAAGLHFDASSSYEATDLLEQGIAGSKISLSSQQSVHPVQLRELLRAGVKYVATSMHQLELYRDAADLGARVSLRVNPAVGHGHNNRLTTGGINSSFGLWHDYLRDAYILAATKGLIIDRLHVHFGSGADPSVWDDAIQNALSIARRMPDVTTLDIGGGYKVARSEHEAEADMQRIAKVFARDLQTFADATGRKLKLEIEPGTWLVAHAGILIAQVDDIVDTGTGGHKFLRLNTGMNDIIRPAMYGSYHRIEVMNSAKEQAEYLVVGHNCETSDILTVAPHDPEHIAPRKLNRARIGDTVAIADTGAYCAGFSTHGYNAFPSAKEVFID